MKIGREFRRKPTPTSAFLDTLGVEQIPAGLRRGFYMSVRESIQ
jgi:hypothetical protein